MTGPFSQFDVQLAWLAQQCCGGQATAGHLFRSARAELESTPLLRDDDDGGPLDAPGVIVLSPPVDAATVHVTHPDNGHAPDTVLVMRHAHREDEDDETWTMTAARPWDPPLSKLGREQARGAGEQLLELQPSLQIEYVITSPFLRCLQTSAEAVKALGLPQGRWLVDWSMGEIAEPRLLLGGRSELEDKFEGRPIETWMWGGRGTSEALAHWVQGESLVSGVPHAPVVLPRPRPPYPEARESAMGRYEQELAWLAAGGRGALRGNCLVVTHGEAVRCAVNLLEPDATVYEVKHCSHVKLTRETLETDENGQQTAAVGGMRLGMLGWQLACKSGQSGVSWFA